MPELSDAELLALCSEANPDADGLLCPCRVCGTIPVIDYNVDDEYWRASVPKEMRPGVICLLCLVDMVGRDAMLHVRILYITVGGVTRLFVPGELASALPRLIARAQKAERALRIADNALASAGFQDVQIVRATVRAALGEDIVVYATRTNDDDGISLGDEDAALQSQEEKPKLPQQYKPSLRADGLYEIYLYADDFAWPAAMLFLEKHSFGALSAGSTFIGRPEDYARFEVELKTILEAKS